MGALIFKDNIMWIIGDIHGRFHTLKSLVEKLPEDAEIICTGDLIDRGANSQEVIRYIKNHPRITSVLGNHDAMITDEHVSCHLHNGGHWFYKLSNEEQKEIKDFLGTLPLTKLIEVDGKEAVVSHAPMCSVARQDILWNICEHVNLVPEFNIFGHVIQENGPLIMHDRIGIDTGLEKLSAIQWPTLKIISEPSHKEDFTADWWGYLLQHGYVSE